MENLRFEESFKEAFSGAEIAPSGVVWTNVELGLEKSSGGKLKGRILFFQLLAAASMVFAMGVGSVYFLETGTEPSHSIAQESFNSNSKQEVTNNNQSAGNDAINQQAGNDVGDQTSQKLISKNDLKGSDVITAIEQPNSEMVVAESTLISNNRNLPKLVEIETPRLKIATSEPDPGMLLLAKLHDQEKAFQKTKPTLKEKIWASLGIGAGSYNPNSNGTNVRSSMALDGKGHSGQALSDPSSGTSYSVGVSIASKVSKRIVIQGGIAYLNQNSTYTSNTASGSGAFLNDYLAMKREDATYSQVSMTAPYQVNNNLQYMSIPLQAGYIIVDRDFGVQLNAGIATDVFFQNTLTPEGIDLNEVTQGAGADSPYRTLNFSGLLGTEVSYKVSDHYRIAVNPGVRYALNSIYKSDVAADASPFTFDVALRFRYMF